MDKVSARDVKIKATKVNKEEIIPLFRATRNTDLADDSPSIEPVDSGFQLQYEHPHGRLYQGILLIGLSLLRAQVLILYLPIRHTTLTKPAGITLKVKKSTLIGPLNG